jgi:hypothetical protein
LLISVVGELILADTLRNRPCMTEGHPPTHSVRNSGSCQGV